MLYDVIQCDIKKLVILSKVEKRSVLKFES